MLDVKHIIESGGILLVSLIVFAESGLLLGFFLPGDTLLFSAGFFASQGQLNIYLLVPAIVLSSILGDNVGYHIGKKTGPRIFRKKDGIIFRHEYIEKAEQFYEKHGGKTVILARFFPILRTFSPVVAGVGHMDRKKYIPYTIIGGVSWGTSLTLLGYWLGGRVTNIEKYLVPVFLVAVVATWTPALYHLLKDERTRKGIWSALKKKFRRIKNEA